MTGGWLPFFGGVLDMRLTVANTTVGFFKSNEKLIKRLLLSI